MAIIERDHQTEVNSFNGAKAVRDLVPPPGHRAAELNGHAPEGKSGAESEKTPEMTAEKVEELTDEVLRMTAKLQEEGGTDEQLQKEIIDLAEKYGIHSGSDVTDAAEIYRPTIQDEEERQPITWGKEDGPEITLFGYDSDQHQSYAVAQGLSGIYVAMYNEGRLDGHEHHSPAQPGPEESRESAKEKAAEPPKPTDAKEPSEPDQPVATAEPAEAPPDPKPATEASHAGDKADPDAKDSHAETAPHPEAVPEPTPQTVDVQQDPADAEPTPVTVVYTEADNSPSVEAAADAEAESDASAEERRIHLEDEFIAVRNMVMVMRQRIAAESDSDRRAQLQAEMADEFAKVAEQFAPEDGYEGRLETVEYFMKQPIELLSPAPAAPDTEPTPDTDRPGVDLATVPAAPDAAPPHGPAHPEAVDKFRKEAAEKTIRPIDSIKSTWEKLTGKSLSRLDKGKKHAEKLHLNEHGDKDLREARAAAAAIMAFRERTAFRGVKQDDVDKTLEAYKQMVREQAPELAKELNGGKELTAENRDDLMARVVLSEHRRMSEMAANIVEKRGGKGSRALNWWRKHPKVRVGVGIVTAGAGVAFGVGTGAGIAVLGAKGVMRGVGAYSAYRAGSELHGAKHDRKSGKHEIDSAKKLGVEDLKDLGLEATQQRWANILSAQMDVGAKRKYAEADQLAENQLHVALGARYHEAMKGLTAEQQADKIAELMTAQMEAANKRSDAVRGRNRARFVKGVLIGGAAVIAPFNMDHIKAGGGKVAEVAKKVGEEYLEKDSVGRGVAADAVHAVRTQVPEVASTVAETAERVVDSAKNTEIYADTADIVTGVQHEHLPDAQGGGETSGDKPWSRFKDRDWAVKPGENMWSKAKQVLEYHNNSYGKELSADQKLVAINELTKSMGGKSRILSGEHYAIGGKDVWKAIQTAKEYKG